MSGATNWRYIAFLWQITISNVFHSRLNTFSSHQPQKPTTFSPTFYNTGISSEWDMWRHDALREGLVIEESGSYQGMLQLLRQDCAMLWATRESAVLVLSLPREQKQLQESEIESKCFFEEEPVSDPQFSPHWLGSVPVCPPPSRKEISYRSLMPPFHSLGHVFTKVVLATWVPSTLYRHKTYWVVGYKSLRLLKSHCHDLC